MLRKINDIKQVMPETKEEIKWFSLIRTLVEDTGYGKVELELTVKGGKLVSINNIKQHSRFNLN